MSTMEPMYGIPSALRYALVGFTRWDDIEIVECVIKEVRDLLKEHASKLTVDQVKSNMEYVEELEAYLKNLVDTYSQMGITLSQETIKDFLKIGVNLSGDESLTLEVLEEKEKNGEKEDDKIEYTPEQKFYRHVLADYKGKMNGQLTICLLTLKALDIAKEELGKYIPENIDALEDKKTLNKNDRNINI